MDVLGTIAVIVFTFIGALKAERGVLARHLQRSEQHAGRSISRDILPVVRRAALGIYS